MNKGALYYRLINSYWKQHVYIVRKTLLCTVYPHKRPWHLFLKIEVRGEAPIQEGPLIEGGPYKKIHDFYHPYMIFWCTDFFSVIVTER